MNRVDYIANDHDETKCDDSGVNASLSDKMLSEKPALCDIIKPNNSGDNSTEKSVLCDIIKPNNSGDNSTEKSVLCDIIKPYNSGDNSTVETNCDDISYFCDLNDEMLCTNLFSCSLDLESEVKNSDSLYNKGDHEMSVLLNKHTKLFTDGLGKFSKGEANIFIDESVKPVFCKARPLPYAIKDKVEKELDSMVEKEILSPVSYAEWAAPIVPIQKRNGGIRICGDFKVTVNKCSEKDKYPIPRIEDLYTKLAGGTVFSVLDLSMAYQQIVVNQRSRRYLTINTTRGLFTFNRLPAGICAAPGIFQRIMDGLFSNVEGVVCYLDDILVCGKDIQDHNKNLDIVFSILYQSGLKLKKDKCLLAESSVKYLGHIIDAKGLHPLASKVEAIQNAPAPTNVNELQSFIGLISYYGKFLSNMSTVMAPLYELLRKDTDWAWEKDQIEAFDKCKTLIISDSVLVHFDPQYSVVLACDASPYGIGCVLSHSIDGIEKPIAFYSRTLKPAEKNYSVLDKEALSVVWWPNIDKDIENYVKSCDNCQSVSAVSTMSTIHPWEWPGKPWIRIHIDYAGPFNGKMYLIVIDSYSKWIEIIPTTSATAEATVTILREIFSRWGLPLMIVSDNATCFTSYIFTDFCKHNAIKHITSSPHHPSTNGLAERAVQVFKHGVKKITGDIDTNISHFLLHYRSCPQSTTGETPSMLMMKRQIRTRIDILLPGRQNDVTLKQAKMLGKGSQRTFYAGDPVYVLNFSQNNKQTKWLSGVIMNKQGPLTYIIELDDGRMFKRHTDHIRYRVLTNIGENSAQADSAPNVVLSENQENDGQMTPYSDPSVKVPRNVPSGSQGVNTPSDQSSVATASLPDEECLSEQLKSSTGVSYTDGQINVSHSPEATRRDSSRLSPDRAISTSMAPSEPCVPVPNSVRRSSRVSKKPDRLTL